MAGGECGMERAMMGEGRDERESLQEHVLY